MTGDSAVYRRSTTLLEAEVDGEIVALDADQGTCFGFNRTATRIWQLLEQPQTLDQLCVELSREFDIEPASCRSEVAALLDDLRRSGLISAAPETGKP